MPDDGSAGKKDGMGRAYRHADPEWKRVILICIKETALRKPYFTRDDVEAWRLACYPNHTTHENRALGPMMKEGAKLGYCVKMQVHYESTQKSNHCRPVRMWFSLIYKGPGRFPKPRYKPPDPRQFNLF